MAKPPPITAFKKGDYGTDGLGSQDALDKLFPQLNSWFASVRSALANGLTSSENSLAEVKSFTVTTPTSSTGAFPNGYPFADYFNTGAQSVLNNNMTVVNFDTKVTDTDNAVTTGAGWVWTCPPGKGGTYSVQSSVALNSAIANGTALLSILKNGTSPSAEFHRGNRIANVTAGVQDVSVSSTVLVVPGNTISIGIYQATGATQQVENPGSVINNWVQIHALNLYAPPVLSCFPLTVSTKVTNPVRVSVMQVSDLSTTPQAMALGDRDWNRLNGAIRINNLPGLLLGKTYRLSLLIEGQ